MVTSAVFACVGTAGQRCTTLRRLIVHEDLYDEVRCLHIVSAVFDICFLHHLLSLLSKGVGETEKVLRLHHGKTGRSP